MSMFSTSGILVDEDAKTFIDQIENKYRQFFKKLVKNKKANALEIMAFAAFLHETVMVAQDEALMNCGDDNGGE